MTSKATSISVVMPVHRDGLRAVAAARLLLRQSLPAECGLEIVIVDDGSDDDTPQQLAGLTDDRVAVLRLPENAGRSAARNVGAAHAVGQLIVFMDCDCVPVGNDYLLAHAEALESDAVASKGHVEGDGSGFWSRYQADASERRGLQHAAGLQSAGSSQNLAVLREAFEAAGGFDPGYRRYGFEDRDLLVRLSGQGRIAWAEGARVRHTDALTMSQVASKMMEAGEFTSLRFARQHPDIYRALGYARVDLGRGPWRRLAAMGRPLVTLAAHIVDPVLAWDWMPYRLRASLVRVVSGLAYMVGTSRRRTCDANQ
jgi:glycosyltransferase involved in cell wall biosynthesis